MNYEQFYYWLKGYMDCTSHNSDILFQEVKEALIEEMKKVNLPKVLNTSPFTSQIHQGIIPLNCS